MSNAIMTMAWKAKLTAAKKVVLVALADAANDRGECFPSVQTLAGMCSLSDRAVQKAVAELEKDGYLERDQRKGRSTVYRITVENRPEESATTYRECLMCGRDDKAAQDAVERYELEAKGAGMCEDCAEVIANAYAKRHSGKWLTWNNEPQQRKNNKAKIPAELRRLVYERDAYRCVKCGGYRDLTVDHIHPESLGGATDEGNLQTMCRSCNSKKGARTEDE